MIELAKARCPLLNVMRVYAGIKREIPDKKEEKKSHNAEPPDIAGVYKEPAKSTGQDMVDRYYLPFR